MNNVIVVVFSDNGNSDDYQKMIRKYVKIVGYTMANNEEIIIKAMIPKCAIALDDVVKEAKRVHDLKEIEKPFTTREHALKKVVVENPNNTLLRQLMVEQEVIKNKIREEVQKIGNSNISYVPDTERPKIDVKIIKLRRSAGGFF